MSFAICRLSSVLFMNSIVVNAKPDLLKKSPKQRRVQMEEKSMAPRSIWGTFLETQLAKQSRMV